MKQTSTDLEPEVILPEQFWSEPHVPLDGAAGLLWTVLVDGVLSYREAVIRGATRGYEFRETEQWIFGVQHPLITSFENLCSVFGVNARNLRLELLRLREEVEMRWQQQRRAS